MALSKEAEDYLIEVREGFADDERFCRESLVVQNKEGALIPGVWGPSQRLLFEGIRQQQSAGQPVRIVALKPRQAYMSTGVAMKFFKETAFVDGQAAIVLAHDEASALKIFEYYKRFQKEYKPFGGIVALPNLITPRNLDSPKVELLKWENGSSIEIETANNVKGGRSFTSRRIHLSEYAFYRDAAPLMTGLLQSLPDDAGTMLVVESTANGMGGAFYDLWEAAREGRNDFLWLFLAWWEHPEYRRPLDRAKVLFEQSLTNDEYQMLEAHGLTFEQINWRRWAIRNKCEGDEDRFRQEYPATPEEAFIVSGRPRFRPVYIRNHQAIEGQRGELRVEEVALKQQIVFTPNERGALTIFERPQKGRNYVLGADTAEGIDVNDGIGTADPDYSSGDVFDSSIRAQVAQIHERLTPAEFGRYIYYLGAWYNWAYLVIEVNGIGQGTLDKVIELGYPLDRIYCRVLYDEAGRPRTKKQGFKTTNVTREQLISGYENALANFDDGGIILRSAISIKEAYTFVTKPSGRVEAQSGCHDDTIFSGGLSVEGLKYLPALPATARGTPQKPTKYRDPLRDRIAQAMK